MTPIKNTNKDNKVGRPRKGAEVSLHIKFTMAQYKFLKEESNKRGYRRGSNSSLYMCEIVREAIDMLMAKDQVTIVDIS